jgi:hypothetical protein
MIVHLIKTHGVHGVLEKGIKKITACMYNSFLKIKDLTCDTRIACKAATVHHSYVRMDFPAIKRSYRTTAPHLVDMYRGHYFDLLGSGWVSNGYDSIATGLEGHRYEMNVDITDFDRAGEWLSAVVLPAHRKSSKKIWQNTSAGYQPIDWQKDFKSGYRWSAKRWFKDQPFGHKPGVDIKVPWELGRLQHLAQMSLCAATLPEFKEDLLIEFKNQTLDFIASNPPRMGVNWACTMDTAIRAANMLIAFDIFKQLDSGNILDDVFKKIFSNFVYEHGVHIVNNLEYSEKLTANHYLANIAGLLFIAAYLDNTPETDLWLPFAVQELAREVRKQFHADGTCFEASTSYHRLSAEMVIYSTALVLALPREKREILKNYKHGKWKYQPALDPPPIQHHSLPMAGGAWYGIHGITESPFPGWYFEKLERMAEFTMHITKPNRHIHQVGDNDSGRFFKLHPSFIKMTVAEAKARYLNLSGYNEMRDHDVYLDEDVLDHRHLVSAINSLYMRKDFKDFTGSGWVDEILLRNISGRIRIRSYHEKKHGKEKPAHPDSRRNGPVKDPVASCSRRRTIRVPKKDLKGLKPYPYPDFGLYIFKSTKMYLALRCAGAGQNGTGGHAHNDQLALELHAHNTDIFSDPGTYLYTPLPERRNEFRRATSHETFVYIGDEQEMFGGGIPGLFSLATRFHGIVLDVKENHIRAMVIFNDEYRVREVAILDGKIEITDYSNTYTDFTPGKFRSQSNGYGKIELANNRRAELIKKSE